MSRDPLSAVGLWSDVQAQFVGRHLRIQRHDGKPITASWSELQQIIHEMAGPNSSFVEVYPAEHRVVDEANIRHFWEVTDEQLLGLGLTLGGR